MLRELHIANFAVIEDAKVELREGLNCFTGQTGAGKSLMIGAVEVLLGLRAGVDMLRDGAEEGRVSGVFELADAPTIRRIGELLDLDATDGQLLVTRKLFRSGRTSFSINGSPATASMLRAVAELLVDVHGQHDHQYLLKPANQLEMLDRFAGCEAVRAEFAALHRGLAELRHRRAELDTTQTLRRQQLELYEFQAEEIDAVEPTEGEYEEVSARHRLLSNLQKVQRDAGEAYAIMYEADGSVLERLQVVTGVLRQLSELDGELSPVAESARAAAAQVQDAAFDLSRYLHRIDLDPAELADVTERLNALNRLIHKYGKAAGPGHGLADVLAYRRQLAADIDRLRGESSDLASIDAKINPVRTKLAEVGERLTAARQAAAERIKPMVERELGELGMPHATFGVEFTRADPDGAESPTGLDTVEMLVRANPGQAARPLRKVASGGELSRIMLAIKSILADADRIGVLVFDEIDANIGGRIASVVGHKLRALAARHQVLCITHLPQIAAYADHHVKISKAVERGQTHTRVEPLNDQDSRIAELAEMLTGARQSETTRKQAAELLEVAHGPHRRRPSDHKVKPPKRLRLTG